MKARFLFAALAALLLFSCATTDDSDKPKKDTEKPIVLKGHPYTSAPGPIPVGAIPDAMLHDAQRNKDLHMSIEYPTRLGPHPIIIFSPGLGGSQRGYVGLSSYWTSYGYVVIKPTHADAGTARELREDEDVWEKQTVSDWQNRVRDVLLIVDRLNELEQLYPELAGKMDHARIGVGGHSYGAFTALLAGGARTFATGAANWSDPRVTAVLAMSPVGTSQSRGLTRESFTGLKVPVMFMTGSKDMGATASETPEWRHEAFELSPAGDKWFVSLNDARHFTFTGRFTEPRPQDMRNPNNPNPVLDPNRDPRDQMPRTATDPRQADRVRGLFQREEQIFWAVRSISLAFWDAYLRNEPDAKTYLQKLNTRQDLKVETK